MDMTKKDVKGLIGGPHLSSASPLGFSVPMLGGITPQDLGIDKIMHYFENPDEKPPSSIKNMVKLLKMMKENEENSDDGDESSGLFYSSDESVEDSEYDTEDRDNEEIDEVEEKTKSVRNDKSKTLDQKIVSSECGLSIPGAFLSHYLLKRIELVQKYGNHISIYVRYTNNNTFTSFNIDLDDDVDKDDVISKIHQWLIAY